MSAQNELKTPPFLVRVYSENETNNFNLKTGQRIFDDYKHRNTNFPKITDRNEPSKESNEFKDINKVYGNRHNSVNETTEQGKDISTNLWSAVDKRNMAQKKLYNNIKHQDQLTPDKKVINGEDDDRYLDLYFKDNLDSIIYDNECLIPLEQLPRVKSSKNLKRKRDLSLEGEAKNDASSMMYDEYIPDLDFINNFKRMQEYYEVNPTFDNDLESNADSFEADSRSQSNVLNEVMEHSHVIPMDIKSEHASEAKISHVKESSPCDTFIDVTKLPLEFENLPYSHRKRILIELCPNRDYQDILHEMKRSDNQLKRMKTRGCSLNTPNSLKFPRSNKSYTSTSTADSILKRFDSATSSHDNHTTTKNLKVMGYNLKKIIGRGAWGVIRECTNESDSSDVKAMKIVKYRDNLSVKLSVINEVSIWKNLRHKNILSLVDYMQGDNAMFCLMNQIHGGTLYDYVVKRWYNNEEEYPLQKRMSLVENYSKQIICALEYLHNSAKVVHGDLKLENCLMTTAGTVLLCDFGMARKMTSDDISNQRTLKNPGFKKIHSYSNLEHAVSGSCKSSESRSSIIKNMINDKSLTHDDTPLGITAFDANIGPAHQSTVLNLHQEKHEKVLPLNQIGSLPYAAPELLNIKNKINPKTDIWALGVLIYTMCVYKLPFQHAFEPRLKLIIESGKYNFKKLCDLVMKSNPGLCFVVEGCLTKSTDDRWDLEKIKRNLELH